MSRTEQYKSFAPVKLDGSMSADLAEGDDPTLAVMELLQSLEIILDAQMTAVVRKLKTREDKKNLDPSF